jgi:hypothetical protein
MDELSDESREILTTSVVYKRGCSREFATVNDQEEQHQPQQPAAAAANAPLDLNATYDDL